MAHEIETFTYRGEGAWHGLGIKMDDDMPLDDWAESGGFNWTINSTRVEYVTENGWKMTFPNRKVLYRSDDGASLAVVSNRYEVVQPKQIIEFFRDLTDLAGFKMETAGVLRQGKKYFALAQTGRNESLGGANDSFLQYLLLATACDGTLATTAMLTSVRVVCANTLRMATEGNEGKIRICHSSEFNAEDVKEQLGVMDYNGSMQKFMEQMEVLNGIKVSDAFASKFFAKLLAPNQDERVKNGRAIRGHADMIAAYQSAPGATPGTAYGVLNAVTHFVDHTRGKKNRDAQMTSLMFGSGAAMKARAANELMALAA